MHKSTFEYRTDSPDGDSSQASVLSDAALHEVQRQPNSS